MIKLYLHEDLNCETMTVREDGSISFDDGELVISGKAVLDTNGFNINCSKACNILVPNTLDIPEINIVLNKARLDKAE